MIDGNYFYNQTIRKTAAVFGTLFNNIKLVKGDKSEIRVPLAYGPRAKYLSRISEDPDLEDSKIAIKLPRMSFEITAITYDAESSLNKFNKTQIDIAGSPNSKLIQRQSVPYDIGIQLNILGKSQDDVLQILEQILPYFRPEYTVSVKDMDAPGISADVPVILKSVSFTDDYEADFVTRRSLIYTLDFEMKVRFTGDVKAHPIINIVDADFLDFDNSAPISSMDIDGTVAPTGIDEDGFNEYPVTITP